MYFQVHCKSGQCLSPDLDDSGGDNGQTNISNDNVNTSSTTVTLPGLSSTEQSFQLAPESHRSLFLNPINQQRFPRFSTNNPTMHGGFVAPNPYQTSSTTMMSTNGSFQLPDFNVYTHFPPKMSIP
ncbi:unnamed protein product [Wuchereria bancrofti]|uniref:Uncharacterized protein n=1 Tax=Wuchereria bancrofti TaxID=6293 RepID=A0A3P7EG61_WUCBA|nr:unnamed protein product [Wuchereria bancrofti]